MTTNLIPTAELRSLFPGIGSASPLMVHGSVLDFPAPAMPVLLPHEQLVLAALVRHLKPRCLVEFGTAHGRSTYVLAANSPAEAEIFTIDLAQPTDYSLKCMRGDAEVGCCLRGTDHEAKARQLLRRHPEELPAPLPTLKGQCDFLLIDGDHGYRGVRTDTLAALELAAAGATLVWHDFYSFPSAVADPPEKRGVYPFLNELMAENRLVLRHILGTFYVVGRLDWPNPGPGVVLQPGDTPGPFGSHNVRLAETGPAGHART